MKSNVSEHEADQAGVRGGDYVEFYSHLAIQARRASRVALFACAVALAAIIVAIAGEMKPPIVLRVQKGKVVSLAGSGVEVPTTVTSREPSQDEKLAFVASFLEKFVDVDPLSVKRNTTEALNMMTGTLRERLLRKLNEERYVDQIRDDDVTATLRVKSAEGVPGDPYTVVVLGEKRMTSLVNGEETQKELLAKYTIRLAPVPRAASNQWTGLEIADYKEEVLGE
ncbi:MAG TPA: hypothetical protein VFZ08_14325 [Terriglobia bacterium]|nr:hypothetical protein [Terriglobia bacterium]